MKIINYRMEVVNQRPSSNRAPRMNATNKRPSSNRAPRTNAVNKRPSSNRAPRWALIMFGLPAFALIVAIMSLEASMLAKFQRAKDVSSLFVVRLDTDNIRLREVFKPVFERAGRNLSDWSTPYRYSAGLMSHYDVQEHQYKSCPYYDDCDGPMLMGESMFSDFPRQLLLKVTTSIKDKAINGTLHLESPSDVVPLVPEAYMKELFKSLLTTHKKALTAGLVLSTVGVILVTVSISVMVIKSAQVEGWTALIAIVFIVQAFKTIPIAVVTCVNDYTISSSKAQQLLSTTFSACGLTISKCWPIYHGSDNGGSFMLFIIPMAVGGFFSAGAMDLIAPKLTKPIDKDLAANDKYVPEEEGRNPRLV